MKRFYKSVTVGKDGQGYCILLDGRPVRTPARRTLLAPARALANAVAGEWSAQKETVQPEAMPLTRLVTSTVDLMPERRPDAIAEIAGYGTTDLLCYRAAEPPELVLRQARLWQPWLDWAAASFDASLVVTDAVTPIDQPAPALERLREDVGRLTDWRLVGLHAAVRLTGSLVLGLAMERGALDAAATFDISLLEETFEIERWGSDAEQQRRHDGIRRDLAAAQRYFDLLR